MSGLSRLCVCLFLCVFAVPVSAEKRLVGDCAANGSYDDTVFIDQGDTVTLMDLEFGNIRRRDNKIIGTATTTDYLWTFHLYNETDLKVNIMLSTTSMYNSISGSIRTNWSYVCTLDPSGDG